MFSVELLNLPSFTYPKTNFNGKKEDGGCINHAETDTSNHKQIQYKLLAGDLIARANTFSAAQARNVASSPAAPSPSPPAPPSAPS